MRGLAAGRFLLAAILAAGCSRPLPLARPDPAGPLQIDCCAITGAPVEVTYLGVGGWVVRRGASVVLFAPLFSNPSLIATGLGTIAPDTARIDGALDSLGVDLSDVSVILSGHGHYDHLMDVPRVMTRHAPRAVLLANATSKRQLAPWRLADRITVVDDSVGDVEAAGRWIRVGDVRVMAFRSFHGPHFDGHTLFRGSRERDLETAPATAAEWLDGNTVSYLIDFLEAGRPAFRMFYQDAVAAEPFGLVADSLLDSTGPDGRPVDLAVLVPSTFAEVPWHPEALIDNLRPRHVFLGHWEYFFASPFEEPRALDMMDDFGHFGDRLERGLRGVSDPPPGWHMPVAGARFLIR